MIKYQNTTVTVNGFERIETRIATNNSKSGSFNYSVHERRYATDEEIQTEKENRLYKELGIIKCEMH